MATDRNTGLASSRTGSAARAPSGSLRRHDVLAVEGGRPAVPRGAVVPWCPIAPADRAAIDRVLDGGVLAGARAPETVAFEQEWAEYLDTRHALLTNSGTAALHLALAGVGVAPGDEVIVPAYTFVASATAVLHHNAIPVFVDVDLDTLCLDANMVAAAVTPRTRAVVVVHLNGQPAAMAEICAVARRYGLAVVEDACQAHGASVGGRAVGTLGDAAAFSLNKSKSLPAGEGGIFVTNDDAVFESARRLAKFGEIYDDEGARTYEAFGMGWMYRATEFTAALARSRLRNLRRWTEERSANRALLDELLADVAGLRVLRPAPGTRPAPWRYAFQLTDEEPRRPLVAAALRAEGVPVCEWQRMVVPAQTLFKRREGYGRGCPWSCAGSRVEYDPSAYPAALDAIERTVWICDGVQPGNSEATLRAIAAAVEKVMRARNRLVRSGD
jgi:dTDP-4-amino-4,6-dideoxygalactose transaminase